MKDDFKLSLDAILIIFGLFGVYMYGFYSIIAITDHEAESEIDSLFLPIHVLSIVEGTLQSGFIINALKMYTPDKYMRKQKPCRSLITILIFLDLCLWGLDTLNVKKYDMSSTQLGYYNIVFWSIASSISTPLSIFFRFHSSVCLTDIWKTLYENTNSTAQSNEELRADEQEVKSLRI